MINRYASLLMLALMLCFISSSSSMSNTFAIGHSLVSTIYADNIMPVQGEPADNEQQDSIVNLSQQSGQGIGNWTVPIEWKGTIWNLLGPATTRNLPTPSTAAGAVCSGDQGGDADGDAICDNWESPTTPGTPPNDATHRYVRCPTTGGGVTFLDSLCTSTTAKYNLCFKDEFADVWGNPPHAPNDIICPKPGHKDLFVEIDFMTNHDPDTNAIKDVIKAFGNAPITNTAVDDFGRSAGITLHVVEDETLTRITPIWAWQDFNSVDDGNYNNDFKSIKERHFGLSLSNPANLIPVDERAACPPNAPCPPATISANLPLLLKHYAYHYATFIVNWQGSPPTTCGPSGTGETLGNDFIVSLGCGFGGIDPLGGTVGTKDEQAGTFMHELGHNLNLAHGGPALSSFGSSNYNTNCKPNELSVMSWSRQVPSFVSAANWVNYKFLDYSRGAVVTLPPGTPLTEGSLVESLGLAVTASNIIIYGTPATPTPVRTATLSPPGGQINWDGLSGTGDTVSVDINNLALSPQCVASSGQTHRSMDEWSNLQYYFLNDWDGQDGLTANPPSQEVDTELTGEMVQNLTKLGNQFSGLLDPINSTGSSIFDRGETIPVRFQFRDINGDLVPNANITFTAERINGSLPGSNLSSSYPPTQFKYNNSNDTYEFEWPTSDLQEGTWAIHCLDNFGNATMLSVLQGPPPIPSGMSGMLSLKVAESTS